MSNLNFRNYSEELDIHFGRLELYSTVELGSSVPDP
jgi:hypothetical protein